MTRITILIAAVVLAGCATETAVDTTPASSTTVAAVDQLASTTTVAVSTTTTSTTTTEPSTTTSTTLASLDTEVTTLVDEIDAATGGIAIAPDGTLYVADIGRGETSGGSRVYAVSPSGDVELLADNDLIQGATGNVVAPDGTLYQASLRNGAILRIGQDGSVDTITDQLAGPVGIAIDGADGFVVADCLGHAVVKVSFAGEVTPFAKESEFRCPNGIVVGEDGTTYMSNFQNGAIFAIAPDGTTTHIADLPGGNNGHLAFADGTLFAVDRGGNAIYTVARDGTLTLVAGTGAKGVADGTGTRATFNLPNGIAIGTDQRIFVNQSIADGSGNQPVAIRVITLTG